MTSTLHPATGAPAQVVAPMELEDADSAAEVLAFARAERAASMRAEANLLAAAVVWADQHPAESLGVHAATSSFNDGSIPIAGEGAPLVAEFCIPELAAALGMSTDSGKRLVGQALELAYRLPRHWARVQDGTLPAWRARRLAEATMTLPPEGAAWVDTRLAAYLHKTTYAAQDRLIAEAIALFDPARAEEEATAAEDRRHVRIDTDQIGSDGTIHIDADLDIPDALDLQAALRAEAQHLKNLGSTDTLDTRRAHALGNLARTDHTLDLDTTPDETATPAAITEPAGPTKATDATAQPRKQRPLQMVLHVHLSEAALRAATGTSTGLHLARVENTRSFVTAEQVRAWCTGFIGGPDVQITVKPVIDLEDHIHVEAYEAPHRLREQTQLRDLHCIFPWCRRPATTCDHEHAVPHDNGGPTCSCNQAPVCRRHHRLKTHAAWSYVALEPGTYVWSSPHGYQYLVDHTGTLDVTPTHRRGRPLPPHAQEP